MEGRSRGKKKKDNKKKPLKKIKLAWRIKHPSVALKDNKKKPLKKIKLAWRIKHPSVALKDNKKKPLKKIMLAWQIKHPSVALKDNKKKPLKKIKLPWRIEHPSVALKDNKKKTLKKIKLAWRIEHPSVALKDNKKKPLKKIKLAWRIEHPSVALKDNKKKPLKKIKLAWRIKHPSVSSASSSSLPPPPPWIELPQEITANILRRLGAIEMLVTAQKVCTTWRDVCMDPAMWREIDMSNHRCLQDMPYDLETMCRHAVDRSKGQLVDINIEYFGTDELLEYIAERSCQLRRFQIACCYEMHYEGLGEAVKRFPLLEELHLSFSDLPSIETVGCSCPLLKSFTLDRMVSRRSRKCDDDAFAIAKNMPELRHLRLFGNEMTNDGLQAILDGCRHLESLDIQDCFNVNLSGEMGKRCSQQIKDLTYYDSTEGYEWDATIFEGFDDYRSGPSDLDDYEGYGYSDYDDGYSNSDNDKDYFDYDEYEYELLKAAYGIDW